MNHFTLVLILLGISLAYAGTHDYGYGDYDPCRKVANVKRDKHGVPLSLIPPDTELVLLAVVKGYHAYTFDGSLWVESGRQAQLYLPSDYKFEKIIGDLSTDAKTVKPITVPNVNQYSFFEDGSYATVDVNDIFTNYSSCDPFEGVFPVSSDSSYPGILTCVTYIVNFDGKGGIPPPLHKKNSYKTGQVYISYGINYAAFYCTSIPSYLSNSTILHPHKSVGKPYYH
jgi:hypothetical protein